MFPADTAVPCGAALPSDRLLALLRQLPGLLPSGVAANVRAGPLCAGAWQYTVVALEGREPLQVVTRSTLDGLAFVTAGTEVCTVGIRAAAPQAILRLAGC